MLEAVNFTCYRLKTEENAAVKLTDFKSLFND